MFIPIATKTLGPINSQGFEFLSDPRKHMSHVSDNDRHSVTAPSCSSYNNSNNTFHNLFISLASTWYLFIFLLILVCFSVPALRCLSRVLFYCPCRRLQCLVICVQSCGPSGYSFPAVQFLPRDTMRKLGLWCRPVSVRPSVTLCVVSTRLKIS